LINNQGQATQQPGESAVPRFRFAPIIQENGVAPPGVSTPCLTSRPSRAVLLALRPSGPEDVVKGEFDFWMYHGRGVRSRWFRWVWWRRGRVCCLGSG
jgi:hypothetical protein